MPSNAVPGFLPSTHGFHFANRWPSTPAFWFGLGYLQVGIGNVADGLCGGMCFAVRDRFEREELPPADMAPPAAGTPLFRELARRQLDSFDRLVRVPWRFWRAAVASASTRDRRTASVEWPAIRAEIDAGRLAMVGLLRSSSPNPLRLGRNHQVAAYAYEVHTDGIVVRIYDPNHPDSDDVTVRMERDPSTPSRLRLSQSTGEPLLGLLALPYRPPAR